jgi:hypothetical protein
MTTRTRTKSDLRPAPVVDTQKYHFYGDSEVISGDENQHSYEPNLLGVDLGIGGWPTGYHDSLSESLNTSDTVSVSDISVGSTSTITDVIGTGPSEYKYCNHQKTSYQARTGRIRQPFYCEMFPRMQTNDPRWAANAFVEVETAPRSIDLEAGWSKSELLGISTTEEHQIGEAWGRVTLGTQQSGFNLPQFAGELGEMRSVYKSPMKRFKRLTSRRPFSKKEPFTFMEALQREGMRIASRNGVPSLRNILRSLAAADLTNQFVLRPLIADLAQLADYEKHWQGQLEHVRKDKTLVAHGTSVRDAGDSLEYYHFSPARYITWKGKLTTKVVATCIYEMGPSFLGPSHAKALGFNYPFSVAWELKPWSFAIDYFISLGEFISSTERQVNNLASNTVIKATGTSVKTTRRAEVQVRNINPYFRDDDQIQTPSTEPLNGIWTIPSSGFCTASKTSESYIRDPKIGHLGRIAPIAFTLPNARQMLNLLDIAALKSAFLR